MPIVPHASTMQNNTKNIFIKAFHKCSKVFYFAIKKCMKCMQSISGNTIKIIKMNQRILNRWNKTICYYESHTSQCNLREKFLGTVTWWKNSYCMLLKKLNYFKNSRDGVRLIKTALICMLHLVSYSPAETVWSFEQFCGERNIWLKNIDP